MCSHLANAVEKRAANVPVDRVAWVQLGFGHLLPGPKSPK